MNGKKAKALRRAALGLATTMSEAGRDIKKDGYQVKTHTNIQEGTQSYQMLVRKDSYKGIYKTLKSKM